MFERALGFLANPWNIWENGSFADKCLVLKLTFLERLAYSRKTGLRTPKFELIQGLSSDLVESFALKSKMAHRGRFELPTP